MPGTELMNVTSTQLTRPQQQNADYADWLADQIEELAIALGQQKVLDTDGIRQASMAKALGDTRRDVMERVFARCHRECTFLPNAPEIRKIYADELRILGEEKRREEQVEADKKAAELRADREAHPDRYVSVQQLIQERGGAEAVIGESRERMRERLTRNQVTIREPEIHECPHCGKGIPFGITDLRGMSASDLRSMADRKAEQEEAVAAAFAKHQQQLSADAQRATQAHNRRRRRDDSPE
jgi:hypothetical protein